MMIINESLLISSFKVMKSIVNENGAVFGTFISSSEGPYLRLMAEKGDRVAISHIIAHKMMFLGYFSFKLPDIWENKERSLVMTFDEKSWCIEGIDFNIKLEKVDFKSSRRLAKIFGFIFSKVSSMVEVDKSKFEKGLNNSQEEVTIDYYTNKDRIFVSGKKRRIGIHANLVHRKSSYNQFYSFKTKKEYLLEAINLSLDEKIRIGFTYDNMMIIKPYEHVGYIIRQTPH